MATHSIFIGFEIYETHEQFREIFGEIFLVYFISDFIRNNAILYYKKVTDFFNVPNTWYVMYL